MKLFASTWVILIFFGYMGSTLAPVNITEFGNNRYSTKETCIEAARKFIDGETWHVQPSGSWADVEWLNSPKFNAICKEIKE